jgi:hypothetical protein
VRYAKDPRTQTFQFLRSLLSGGEFHRFASGERIHGRRVAFLQEVKSSDAARVALVEMVRQARSPEAV